MIYFDIETGPLPLDQIVIPPFDPAQVKTGNTRNPDLIAERIRAAEETHVADFIRNAALDPLNGRVLCIGIAIDEASPYIIDGGGNEEELLAEFWDLITSSDRAPSMVGFNVKAFDLPFLVRRSWKYRGAIPHWLRQGRYWSNAVIDLREVWQLGDNRAHGSLASICRHLGLGEKAGSGADFGKLWTTDNAAAREYAVQDIRLTRDMANVLLGLQPY
jgi:DNA polymerase elongation subunit (family B)